VVDAISAWRRTRGLVVSAGFWAASMVAVWLVYPLDLGTTGSAPLVTLGVALIAGHLVLRTVGEILHSPVATSLMSDLDTESERGSQLSLLEVAKRGGFGLGSFLGGLFFDYGLAAWLWPVLTVVCGLVAVGVLLLEPRVSSAENGLAPAG
jgi:MFS family permease